MRNLLLRFLAWWWNHRKSKGRRIGNAWVADLRHWPSGVLKVVDLNTERSAAIALFMAGLSEERIAQKLRCPPSMVHEYLETHLTK